MDRPALVPELYVSDLACSLDFYVETLGFRVEYERPEERFVSLRLESACLMLEQARRLSSATPKEFEQGEWRLADLERPFGRGMNLEIEVADIEAANARIQGRNQPLLLDPHERSYRVGDQQLTVRRLLVADPDGYLIRLSQRMTPVIFESIDR
jgi:catechol 2,3-dioxygenase-like lactoylglutathione lyase family enzyme